MRIAIFSETYLPDVNGVATHVKILAQGLKSLGHEVLVVTADAQIKRSTVESNILRCPAVRTKKIYNYSLSSPISLSRFRILKKFRPDVIHIHNEFGIGLSGAFIAKLLRVPYVYTLHTMYDDYIYYIAKKRFVPIVTDASHVYFRLLAKHASALTGPSKKVGDYFKTKCGVDRYVNVISNPVELDIFSPEKVDMSETAAFRKQLGLTDDMMAACFCGRLGKEKSVDVLLKSFAEKVKKSDNIRLVIIGDGPDRAELEELSKALEIGDMVFFIGKIPHEKLPVYLCGCQVYITASMSEMHSISMLEAMAAGLPILYINDPSNSSQITDGVNGFIYNNASEMYEKLMYIKNLSKEDYDEFSRTVRESVSASGAEGLAGIMLNVYDEAIETHILKVRNYYEKAN
ncbi:MAG: glycosyltransferase [Oscillospiraceae bacterium]|jgi:1,2-diacylglycerol 3-alpha-glucosyltransferase